MKRFWTAISLLALLILLQACGGGGGGGTDNPPNTAPAAPAWVNAVAGDRLVTLTWSESAGATSYNIYMACETGLTKENYSALLGGAKLTGKTSAALVTGLVNRQPYYFAVTAVKGALESALSVEASATPLYPGETFPVTAPTGSFNDTAATVNGSFTNPAGFTTIAWFEYGPTTAYGTSTPHESFAVVGNVPLTANLTGLSQGTTYHFRLVTQNSDGFFYGGDQTFTTTATPQALADDLDNGIGLASDGSYLYWFEIYGGRLRRANAATGEVSTLATVVAFGNDGALAVDENYVYFTATGAIMRAGKDGSGLDVNFSLTANTSRIVPHQGYLYVRHSQDIFVGGKWEYHHYISRITPDGTGITQLYERLPQNASDSTGFGGGMETDGTYLYFSDYFHGTVTRIPLVGGPAVTLALGLTHPGDLMLDGDYLYVASDEGVKKMPKAGGSFTDVAATPGTMALDGQTLYLMGNGLMKVDLATGATETLVPGAASYSRLALAGNHIYWLESGPYSGNRFYPPLGKLLRIPKP